MIRWYHVVGGIVGLGMGGGVTLLSEHPGLALLAGLVWGTAIVVVGYGNAKFPNQGHTSSTFEESWTYFRWSLLCFLLVYGSVHVVKTSLSISFGLMFSLGILIFGLGLVGFATGYLCALEERRFQRSDAEASKTQRASSSFGRP